MESLTAKQWVLAIHPKASVLEHVTAVDLDVKVYTVYASREDGAQRLSDAMPTAHEAWADAYSKLTDGRSEIDALIDEVCPPPRVVSGTAVAQLRPLLEELLRLRKRSELDKLGHGIAYDNAAAVIAWDEDTTGRSRPCFGCSTLTKGRAAWAGRPLSVTRGAAACIGCAIADTVKTIKAGNR